MSVKNNFSRLLKSLRTKSDTAWTQASMAEELRISRRTYIGWENGENIPSPEYLKPIVTLLKLNKEDEDALYRAAAQTPQRVHNIPFPQNPFFTGREAQLERLRHFLVENGTVAVTQPVSISGLGGIGKTQIALEYAHRSYPNVYRAVFWVNAADRTTLQASYDALTHLLELPERSERESERRVQAVKRWLERHTNWLLIIDNADDLQLARPYLPVKPGGHILLTTRSQIVGTIGRRIEIGEMEPAEGLLFLLRRSGLVKDETEIATISSDIRETASRLVKILGSHPLALDQAGAYIEETGASFAGYIQLYEEVHHDLLNRRGSSRSTYGEHPESVAATLELCFRKACEEHPMAEAVLYYCAFSHSSYVQEFILQHPSFLNLDTKTLNEVIAILRRYSLVKRTIEERESSLSMHPLVQTIFRDILSPNVRDHLIGAKWEKDVISLGLKSLEHPGDTSFDGITFMFISSKKHQLNSTLNATSLNEISPPDLQTILSGGAKGWRIEFKHFEVVYVPQVFWWDNGQL